MRVTARTSVVALPTPATACASPSAWAQSNPPADGGVFGNDIAAEAASGTPGTPAGNGNGNGAGTGDTEQVVHRPLPDCRYFPWMSGPQMASDAASFVVPMFPAPPAGWETDVTDPLGAWYRPDCRFTSGSPEALEQRAQAFRVDNPMASVNPATQTVVGLPTWVWTSGAATRPAISRAESGPNWAQVTATSGRIALTSTDPRAQVGPCHAPLVWSPGAADTASERIPVAQVQSVLR